MPVAGPQKKTQTTVLTMSTMQRVSSLLSIAATAQMSSSSRQSKILRKLVAGKDKAKRRWYQDQDGEMPKLQTAVSLSNPARQGKNAPRRVHVLNKLFMKHITDLLSTGEASEAILGRGLEVSHVKVAADFNYVNVFWRAKDSAQNDEELESILRKASGNIRHELSQLRLMGEVPRVNFIRDRLQSTYAEVQDLLDRADYGDDFTPSNWAQLRQDLAPHGLQSDRHLPEMRHDVLGLNQPAIMDGIKRTMLKSKHAWEQYGATTLTNRLGREEIESVGRTSFLGSDSQQESGGSVIQAEVTKLRDQNFAKFLDQRRRQKHHRRSIKNPDFRDSYERDTYDDFDPAQLDSGDFIEEEFERK